MAIKGEYIDFKKKKDTTKYEELSLGKKESERPSKQKKTAIKGENIDLKRKKDTTEYEELPLENKQSEPPSDNEFIACINASNENENWPVDALSYGEAIEMLPPEEAEQENTKIVESNSKRFMESQREFFVIGRYLLGTDYHLVAYDEFLKIQKIKGTSERGFSPDRLGKFGYIFDFSDRPNFPYARFDNTNQAPNVNQKYNINFHDIEKIQECEADYHGYVDYISWVIGHLLHDLKNGSWHIYLDAENQDIKAGKRERNSTLHEVTSREYRDRLRRSGVPNEKIFVDNSDGYIYLYDAFNNEENMQLYWDYVVSLARKASPKGVTGRLFVPYKEQEKHTYIVGGTGSGKTELIKFLYTQEIVKGARNSILIDPHGDLAKDMINISFLGEKQMKQITYFDPLLPQYLEDINNDQEYNGIPVINPFDVKREILRDDSKTDNASTAIFEALGEIIDKESSVNMKALLVPCITVLLRKENATLIDLKRFMNNETNEDLVELGKQSRNPSHRDYFTNDFNSSSAKSTRQAFSIRLQTLLNNTLFTRITCGKTTIDLERFVRERNKHLIISLNKGVTASIQKPLGSLILTSIMNYAYNVPEQQRIGLHIYIDEFQNFITPSIEDYLSELRKYKVYLTMAHQYTDQIEDTKLQKSILSNTNIKIVGSVGGNTVKKLNNNGERNLAQENVDKLKTGQFMVRIKDMKERTTYQKAKNIITNTKSRDASNYFKTTVPPVLVKDKQKSGNKKREFLNKWLLEQYKKYYQPGEYQPKPTKKGNNDLDINIDDFL